ncbi:hypothetical protein BKA80DRAFT_261871 [Phyllosticta citrichinensis]
MHLDCLSVFQLPMPKTGHTCLPEFLPGPSVAMAFLPAGWARLSVVPLLWLAAKRG